MNKLTVVCAFGMMVSMASGAGAITADGNWSDWFSYGGNVSNNNWQEGQVTLNDPNIRTQSDEEGPTPGGGGQLYDIEQIFYLYEDADPNALTGGRLHIGLVTGFPPEGVPADNLYAGDMFIDIGGDGDYDIAVATSTATTPGHEVPAPDSDFFGQAWIDDGTFNANLVGVVTAFTSSNPFRLSRTYDNANNITASNNVSVDWGGMGPHNFLEISLDVNSFFEEQLTDPQAGGLGLHWTMECGNDVITVQDDDPFTPVPEPSTFVLLGMGVLGGMLRKKFAA